MGLETPTIMSPVGVNSEIIDDGVNGYLATSGEEWHSKLVGLVESADLRRSIGAAARKTVEDRYSVDALKDTYVEYMSELV
jgi:glycosyltransferase involved in cell wall biosynthesis